MVVVPEGEARGLIYLAREPAIGGGGVNGDWRGWKFDEGYTLTEGLCTLLAVYQVEVVVLLGYYNEPGIVLGLYIAQGTDTLLRNF